MQGLKIGDFGKFVYGSDEFKKHIEGVYVYKMDQHYVWIKDMDGFKAKVLKQDIEIFEPQER